jgi:hypothetical protein
MSTITITVQPSGHGKFNAFLNEQGADKSQQCVVENSRTPFCDSARAMLAAHDATTGQCLVAPDDLLEMRHHGSSVLALRATIGTAASRTVNDSSGNGTPRFVRWVDLRAVFAQKAA